MVPISPIRWFRRRRTEQRALTEADMPWMVWPTSTGVALTPYAALRLPAVLACVRLLAESVSTLPLNVYSGNGADRVPAPGPLAALLERPSPGNTLPNLIASVVASLAMQGNAYIGKFRNADGQIEQLAMIPPDRVSVELLGGEPIYKLSFDTTGETLHTTYDVLHLKLLSLDGVLGISPIHHAREALGLAAVVQETAGSMFANGAIPKGVLAVSAGADADDLIENLSSGFRERHGGPRNAGRVAVIDASAVNYSAVGLSPADAQLIEQLRLNDSAIARCFRVPPKLIAADEGGGGSMTYANVEQEGEDFVRFTLNPYLTVIEQAISTDPDLCLPDESVEFDTSRFNRPSALERAQANALARQWGWLDADEIRADEGRPPLAQPLPILAAQPTGELDHALA